MFIIQILGLADGRKSSIDGDYVKSFDPDENNGMGKIVATPDRKKAKCFTSNIEAYNFYHQQSSVLPKRPDGRPNRPLTAFTILVEPLNIESE